MVVNRPHGLWSQTGPVRILALLSLCCEPLCKSLTHSEPHVPQPLMWKMKEALSDGVKSHG